MTAKLPNYKDSKGRTLVPISEASKILGISLDTLRRWDEKGKIVSFRPDGKNRYFALEDLENFKAFKRFSVGEASEFLGISQTTLRRLDEKGILPAKREGNERVYELPELEEFMSSQYFQVKKNLELVEKETTKEALSAQATTTVYSNDNPKIDQIVEVLKEEDEEIHDLINWRSRVIKASVLGILICLVITAGLTSSFLVLPEKTAKFMGFVDQDGNKLIASPNVSTSGQAGFSVLGANTSEVYQNDSKYNDPNAFQSLTRSVLLPFTRVSLAFVEVIDKETYEKVIPRNINELFALSQSGEIIPLEPINFRDSGLLKVGDKGLIKHLNADYLRGKVPGTGAGNLAYFNSDGTIAGLNLENEIYYQTPFDGILGIANGGTGSNLTNATNGGLVYLSGGHFNVTDTLNGVLLATSSGGFGSVVGTPNYVVRWNSSGSSLTSESSIYDNGSVGIGNNNPSQKLDVSGNIYARGGQIRIGNFSGPPDNIGSGSLYYDTGTNQVYYFNGTSWTAFGSGSGSSLWSLSSGAIYPINSTVDALIGGTSSASAKFGFVNVNSGTPAIQINGTTVLNPTTLGSGVVSSSLTSVGNLTAGSIGVGFGSINIGGNNFTAGGAITFSGLTTNGGVLYTNGSGVVNQTTAGSLGECLMSNGGGAPTWGACAASSGSNFWRINAGAISPVNDTLDLLVGSTSSSSAKFGFLNVSGGTPTASISASSGNNATYLTGAGVLGTTNGQTLTVGGTGDIVINPSSQAVGKSISITGGAGSAGNGGNINIDGGDGSAIDGSINIGNVMGSALNIATTATGIPVNIGTSTSTSTITIGRASLTDLALNDAQWSITGAGAASFASLNVNNGGITNAGAVSGVTTLNASSTITFSSFTSNGGVLYTNGSGVLAQATAGTSTQCLLGGTTPTFGSCETGGATIDAYWNQSNGALYPNNSTVDFLVGSQATTSAKFAVLNVNSGTPVASISSGVSGNSAYITSDGTIATQRRMTLSIGNSSGYDTTGNVLINSNGTGRTGIGTTNTSSTNSLAVGGLSGTLIRLFPGTGLISESAIISFNSRGSVGYNGTSQAVELSDADSQKPLLFLTSNGGSSTERMRIATDGNVNIGADATPNELFTVGSTSQFQVNSSGAIAAATGITSSGTITFSSFTSNGGVLYTNGSGVLAQATAGTSTQCLLGGTTPTFGSCETGGATIDAYWNQSNGALYPNNSTVDFLVGSQATTSAKFAVLNVNSGTPVASISANSGNNAMYITGDGTLATTNKQSLTIGNSSTYNTSGNVLVNPNGTGSLRVGTNAGGSNIMAVSSANQAGVTIFAAQINGTNVFTVNSTTGLTLTAGGAANGSINNALTIGMSGAVNVTSETIPVQFNSPSYTITGSYANQRIFRLTQPTITAASSLGITSEASNMYISGAPISAGSATIANSIALRIDAGTSIASGVTNGYGLYVNAPTGASNNYSAVFATGNLGIGDTSPTALLTVGSGDAFQVNSSGAIAAATGITSSGTITFSAFSTNGGLIYTNGSGVLAQTATGSLGECLMSNGGGSPTWGACAGSSSVNYWRLSSGALSPINDTLDFLVGAESTTSAKFAVLNVNGAGPATATVAGSMIIMPQNGAGGTLGIGTINPSAVVHVLKDLNSSSEILNRNTNTGNNSSADFTAMNDTGSFTQLGVGGSNYSSNTMLQNRSYIYSGALSDGLVLYTAGSDPIVFALDDIESARFTATGLFGLGTTSPTSQFYVTRALSQGATGKALAIFDQIESQDILTASASGTTQFILGRTGTFGLESSIYDITGATVEVDDNLDISGALAVGTADAFEVSLAGQITAAVDETINGIDVNAGAVSDVTSLTASSTITFSTFSTNGGLLYTNGSGVLAQTAAGSSSQCLLGGTTPSWGSCSTGGTDSPFQVTSGAINPLNSTLDFLVGGQATTSAKFAVLNVNGTGPATATVAGSMIIMPQNGAGGRLGIGTTNPSSGLDGSDTRIHLANTYSSGLEQVFAFEVASDSTSSNGQISFFKSQGTLSSKSIVGDGDDFGEIEGFGYDGVNYVNSTQIKFEADGTPGLDDMPGRMTFATTADGSNSTTERLRLASTGILGIGTTTANSQLYVTRPLSWGATGKALAIFDQIENQDIFTASSSGTTRFVINNSGYVGIGISTPTELIDAVDNVNGGTAISVTNTNGGTGAYAEFVAYNGSGFAEFGIGGTGYTSTLMLQNRAYVYANSSSNGIVLYTSGSDDPILFATDDTERMRLTQIGLLGIGTDTPISELHVTRALSQGATGKALAIFNQIENQDIFTASHGGTMRFTVGRTGDILLGTSEGAGTSGECLKSQGAGSAAIWDNCSLGGYWTRTAGNLSPTTLNDTISATSAATVPFTATTNNAAGTLTNNTLIQHVAAGTVTNLLTLSRTAGTATIGLNLSGTIGTDISLQNAETISNSTNGTISLGATTTALTGVLTIAGSSGTAINITNTGITTDINMQNGETIDNNVDGIIFLDATTASTSGNFTLSGGARSISTTANNTLTIGGSTQGRVVIDSNTFVGIGTGTSSTLTLGNNDLYVEDDAVIDGQLTIGTGADTSISWRLATSGTVSMVNLDTGTGDAYVCTSVATGRIRTSASSCNPSSLRYKKNITNLDYGIDDIMQLRPVSYEFKDQTSQKGRKIGFIAEEMNLVIPEVVAWNDGEIDGIDYPLLTSLLARGIQQQQLQITGIRSDFEDLNSEIIFDLNNSGELEVEPKVDAGFTVKRNGKEVDRGGAFSEGIFGKIRAGIIESKTINTDSLLVNSEEIRVGDKSLKEYIEENSGGGTSVEVEARIASLESQIETLNAVLGDASISAEAEFIQNQIEETESELEELEASQSGSASNSGDIDADRLRVRESGIIEGILTVVDTLNIGDLVASGVSTFFGEAKFKDNVSFDKAPKLAKDNAGSVSIQTGKKSVRVEFDNTFDSKPLVNVTLVADGTDSEKQALLEADYKYAVTSIDEDGFTILLSKAAEGEVKFNWTAAQVNN